MSEPADMFGPITSAERRLMMSGSAFNTMLRRGFDPSYSVPIMADEQPVLVKRGFQNKNGRHVQGASIVLRKGGQDQEIVFAENTKYMDGDRLVSTSNPPKWLWGLYIGLLRRCCNEGDENSRAYAATQLVKLDLDRGVLADQWVRKLMEAAHEAPQRGGSRAAGRPIRPPSKDQDGGEGLPDWVEGNGGRGEAADAERERLDRTRNVGQGRLFPFNPPI